MLTHLSLFSGIGGLDLAAEAASVLSVLCGNSGNHEGGTMKNVYLYTPEVCDGNPCPLDCDVCPLRHVIEEMEEEQ